MINNLKPSLNFWLDILRENEHLDTFFLAQSSITQSLIEALLLHHIRDEKVSAKLLKAAEEVKEFSAEFISSYKTEMSDGINQSIKDIVLKSSSDPTLKTPQTWIESLIFDLKSSDPAILAHGLYNLRKFQSENAVSIQENTTNLGELCATCLLHDDTYVFMNAVRMYAECSNDILIPFLQALVDKFQKSNYSSKYPRLVEVFSNCIEYNRLPFNLMDEFLKLCLLQVKSDSEENRVSSYNALALLCRTNSQIIIRNQSQIFSALQLNAFEPKALDFETKGISDNSTCFYNLFLVLFTFLDAFLTAISSDNGRFHIKSDYLASIHLLNQRALQVSDTELNSMTINNLMKLEHLRRF